MKFEQFLSAEEKNLKYIFQQIRYGLVARIPGFHPGGSGSIPGTGNFFWFFFCQFFNTKIFCN